MNRNCLFNKALALILCAVLLIGYLPSIAVFASAAENDWESDLDVVETTTEEIPEAPEGSEENPILLEETDNYLSVPAGETVYFYTYFSGVNMTVSGVENGVVNCAGETYEIVDYVEATIEIPAADASTATFFSITNNSGEDGGYVGFAFPAGTIENPQGLWDGENTADTEAATSWYFVYEAWSAGTLTLNVSGASAWTYKVGEAEAVAGAETATIKFDGGSVLVYVEAANVADVVVNAAFVQGEGTEEAPYVLINENSNVTVTGDEAVYYQGYFAGMTVTVSGEGDFSVISEGESIAAEDGKVVLNFPAVMGRPMPNVIGIVGAGDYSIVATYPVGSMENPAEAVLGDNNASVSAGSQGYNWFYIAEEDGTLIVTVNAAAGWTYLINNLTSYQYGDTQWSDSDPVVNPAEIVVTAGDEIQIIANTYDPENPWNAPAGDITVNLAYKSAEHVHEWSDWKEITAASNTTTGLAERTCGACGETETKVIPVIFKIRWASLLLSSNISVAFETSDYVANQYDDIYVVFEFRGQEYIVNAPEKLSSQNRLTFQFDGVASNWMAEEIKATMYGSYNGEPVVSETITYSVKQYCNNRLSKSTSAKEKKMIVDLMNYGGAAQDFTGYKTDDKINKDLTAAQLAMGTQTMPSMTDYQNTSYVVVDNALVTFKSAALILDSAIVAQFKFVLNAGELSDYKIVVESDRTTWEFDATDCEIDPETGRYMFNFDGMYANEMRDLFYVTVYKDGVAVSNTIRYSIETYVARNYGKAGKELQSAMILAMLRYGDSVIENFG